MNPFSELRNDPSLALLVGRSETTRLLVTRQARGKPSSMTTLLPPRPRNSRPTVPPSPHGDRFSTPPRDRAVSPAADQMKSAFKLAVSQLADRFAAQFAAQAAAFSEMMERFEGLHHDRGLRSTFRNAEHSDHVRDRLVDPSRRPSTD